jgi:hypothetical protein
MKVFVAESVLKYMVVYPQIKNKGTGVKYECIKICQVKVKVKGTGTNFF